LIEISAIDADAIVAATAATINFFIIYSVSCEKKSQRNCKDGVNYTRRTPRGRSATNLAYTHLGLKTPDASASSLFDE
jgi:hypothetical protein